MDLIRGDADYRTVVFMHLGDAQVVWTVICRLVQLCYRRQKWPWDLGQRMEEAPVNTGK